MKHIIITLTEIVHLYQQYQSLVKYSSSTNQNHACNHEHACNQNHACNHDNTITFLQQFINNNVYNHKTYQWKDIGTVLYDFWKLRSQKKKLTNLFLFIAKLDAYCSIAQLYKKHTYTKCKICFPYYIKYTKPIVKYDELWNPILHPNKAIVNTLYITDNIIITGPNMGGKSTFLRAMMISILFSQTLTISFCKSSSFTPFYYIQTYLNIPDCKGKESLFEAEMNRAQHYISILDSYINKGKQNQNQNQNQHFSFIIMDEIFSSTNPKEGLAGAYAIANKLYDYKNNISIITTHYTELALLEKYKKYKNYKIPIQRDINNNIIYPYKLYRGISQQYIAIELLQKKGFDNKIISVAKEICHKQETYSIMNDKKSKNEIQIN
tara:strand:- start:1024 stop:2163 length:1140 start_codon:yes stop_codon:yes gene_type:complete